MRRLLILVLSLCLCIGLLGCTSVVPNGLESENPQSETEVVSQETSSNIEQEDGEESESEEISSEEVSSEEISSAETSSAEESPAPQPATAASVLASMTLEQKVYQMFFVRPEGLVGMNHLDAQIVSVDEQLAAALKSYPVGGIALFGGNIRLPGQTEKLISDLQQNSDIPLFIGVDEEGGSVARVGNNPDMGTTAFPPMMSVLEKGGHDLAYEIGYTIGTELLPFGFNLDFAPVADVATNPNNSVIGNRSFSSDAKAVGNMIVHMVRGFSDAGMMTVLKHFPGHGDTAEDSHTELAVTYKTYDDMAGCEWIPFYVGIHSGADMVMVGHIMTPNLDDSGLPATFSSYLLQNVLRDDLGFEGVIITDSLEMGAITENYSSDRAAVLAIQAGVDIILMPQDLTLAVQGVVDAVESGELTEARLDESVLRILELKEKYGLLP